MSRVGRMLRRIGEFVT